MSFSRQAVTTLVTRSARGDAQALEELLPLVYGELHRLAASQLARERSPHTLQATALIHEVYLRMVDQDQVSFDGRSHFFAVASRTIRQVLVDHARAKGALKRGGGALRLELLETLGDDGPVSTELLALDDALARLEDLDPRPARVVELRFFGGLTLEETASAVGVSKATVKRDWETARVWLYRELRPT